MTWSDGYRQVTLDRTLVLRRRDIGIRSCIPMVQDSVPSSDVRRGDLYPHYPLRWRYFDLLRASGGQGEESLLGRLKRGAPTETPPQPAVDDGRATWRLPLRGRAEPMNFVVKQGPSHKAHWMVWPRFHSLSWQAYYVYQHCTDRNTRVDALWLSGEKGQDTGPGTSGAALSRTQAEDNQSYPVRFRGGTHAGGPPVALCARKQDEEIGVYLTGLEPPKEAPARMQIGIDFGTSHTTAAVKLGERPEETIGLSPELAPHTGKPTCALASREREHGACQAARRPSGPGHLVPPLRGKADRRSQGPVAVGDPHAGHGRARQATQAGDSGLDAGSRLRDSARRAAADGPGAAPDRQLQVEHVQGVSRQGNGPAPNLSGPDRRAEPGRGLSQARQAVWRRTRALHLHLSAAHAHERRAAVLGDAARGSQGREHQPRLPPRASRRCGAVRRIARRQGRHPSLRRRDHGGRPGGRHAGPSHPRRKMDPGTRSAMRPTARSWAATCFSS